MTQLVASRKITLLTESLSAEGAATQIIRKLNEVEIMALELGDTSLLLVTKAQLPKALRAPVN